jgi:hypothetical protein
MNTLRKDIEYNVIAMNSCLKSVVGFMDNVILLRNLHPSYRSDFAYALLRNGMITKEEAKEFVKLVR